MKKWIVVGIVMIVGMAGCAPGGYWTKEAPQEQIDRDKYQCRNDAATACEQGNPNFDALSANACVTNRYDHCMIAHGFRWVEGK